METESDGRFVVTGFLPMIDHITQQFAEAAGDVCVCVCVCALSSCVYRVHVTGSGWGKGREWEGVRSSTLIRNRRGVPRAAGITSNNLSFSISTLSIVRHCKLE